MAGTAEPRLAARAVSKAFFGNPVLRGVSIEIRPGRIHALLGENGAGKSTLINLISGALAPDEGQIEIDGHATPRLEPATARRAGIAVVQQELSLTGALSIAENIGLGAFPRRLGLVDYGRLARMASEACRLVGLDEDLSTPVGDLPLGRRQMVEIAKALHRDPRILILDEPTSSLSAHETRTLTTLLVRLRTEGMAILFISHRLNEVLDLCDHVTVLRDGSVTADRSLAGMDAAGLVRLMVGRTPGDLFPPFEDRVRDEHLIKVRGLSAGAVSDADVAVRAGEILGIGGLVGQGQEDLLLGLAGAIAGRADAATINGTGNLPGTVAEANARGLAYVPADRKREGLHLTHAITTNLMLPTFARMAGLRLRHRATESRLAAGLARTFGIKGDLSRPAQALSGGNQQKVALARWIPRAPRILLLNDPTRGVDVETKREIYAVLRAFAAEGKAVILVSSDTLELVHLCDRVAVMRAGRIVATLGRGELDEASIVAAAIGSERQVETIG